jgi:hypothetical protein
MGKSMDKVNIVGLMEQNMKGNTRMI